MNKLDRILKSFEVKDELNPKVWENPSEPKDANIKSDIKKSLLSIAEEFADYLGEDVFVEDVHLTGSLVNFNWSEFSDFDLHLIVDLGKYGKEKELYKDLFNSKKQIFNTTHNIKIKGYDVELYAQDIDEAHYSSGVYSLMDDDWVKIPKKQKGVVDRNLLKTKIKTWVQKIDSLLDSKKTTIDDLKKLKEKLKKYRQSGLEKKGEFSYENLVFKFLRRSGHLERFFDTINKTIDKKLSLEIKTEE